MRGYEGFNKDLEKGIIINGRLRIEYGRLVGVMTSGGNRVQLAIPLSLIFLSVS